MVRIGALPHAPLPTAQDALRRTGISPPGMCARFRARAVGLTAKPNGLSRRVALTSSHLINGRRMYQKFLLLLAVILVAVAPVWSYNSNWSFGPFLAVLFLLGVNLINYLLQDPLTLTGADHQRR
jgi:hypothetical protein